MIQNYRYVKIILIISSFLLSLKALAIIDKKLTPGSGHLNEIHRGLNRGSNNDAKRELNRDVLYEELTGKDIHSDKGIYSQLLLAYQTDDKILLDHNLKVLLRAFPQSPLADNGLYLSGLYYLNHKNYGKAVLQFNRIKQEYSRSNKMVSALFAKGMAYKIMGLGGLAKPILKDVKTRYGGSPEAFRAENELRLIKE